MSDVEGTMIFEAIPPGRSTPVLLAVFGSLGMAVNLVLWAQGTNVPVFGTICGLMLCKALVLRLSLPRRYELSDRKITLVYHGREQSIEWEDVDLILSKSHLRSRDGRKIPLVKVESGQQEFNAFLVRKLRDQLKFETEWHLRNWEHVDTFGTVVRQSRAVVVCSFIAIVCYVVYGAINGDNWEMLSQLSIPSLMLYGALAYCKLRIEPKGVNQENVFISTEDITAILVDMDGPKYKTSIKHSKGTLEFKMSLFETVVALRALAYWNPGKPMTCELHSITGVKIEPEVIRALVTP